MSTPNIPAEEILNALRWRYATKSFDSQRKIPDADWQILEEALVLTPSSFGLQPWKFLVVTDAKVKEELRAASWNQQQVTQCSHHVVFASHHKFSEAEVERFLERTASVQSAPRENLAGLGRVLSSFVQKAAAEDALPTWADRQCYLALEQFMMAAALRGIDTCPMEGFDPSAYDRILGLEGTGYAAIVACAAGYRDPNDRAAARAKVRYDANELFVRF